MKTSVATGCPDSASKVAAPTNFSADAVGTTVTSAPGGAQPPEDLAGLVGGDPAANSEHDPRSVHGIDARRQTPRHRRTPDRLTEGGSLAFGVLEQSRVDLAQRDRQRLLLGQRLDQRADVLQQALAELGVVVVDLPGALGGVDRQAVLGAGVGQQLVDRRVGDAGSSDLRAVMGAEETASAWIPWTQCSRWGSLKKIAHSPAAGKFAVPEKKQTGDAD